MVAFLGSISLWMVQLVAIPVTAVGGGNAPLALLLGWCSRDRSSARWV